MEHEAYLCLETGEIFWHTEIGDNNICILNIILFGKKKILFRMFC